MFDLESLSLRELRQLQKDVEAAITEFKDREKRKVLAEVEAFARERGLNPSDLAEMLSGRKTKKPSGAPKYANPANPEQTWTGRGRKPGWLIESLAAGKNLDSMAI